MNKTYLIGRTTADIELKKTQGGTYVVSFTLAVNRRTKDDGTDFISCVAWSKTAELLSVYVKKGDRIAISGRIQTRNYEDRNGKKIYVTEVVCDEVEFLESKKDFPAKTEETKNDYTAEDFTEVEDDDLPF